MGFKIDLSGKRFGRLKVLRFHSNIIFKDKISNSLWECLCDCGNTTVSSNNRLRKGTCQSCGCLAIEKTRKRFTTHGMRKTHFYKKWSNLKQRCSNTLNKDYRNYGNRGITNLWKNFEEFKKDMYKSYKKHLKKYGVEQTTLERTDVNGPYSKENCRWATRKEQNNNTRTNHFLKFQGKKLSLSQWSQRLGFVNGTIKARLNRGWSIHDALTKPLSNRGGALKRKLSSLSSGLDTYLAV